MSSIVYGYHRQGVRDTNYITTSYIDSLSDSISSYILEKHNVCNVCGLNPCHSILLMVCILHQMRVGPMASYQLHKIAGCACAGNAGDIFPATDFKGNR